MEIIGNFKVIDTVALFIILKALYSAVKYGVLSEGIKISAVFIASSFSFHYYPIFLKRFESDVFKQALLNTSSFCILFASCIFLFFILRKLILFFIRIENPSRAQRLSAIPFALIRSAVFLSTVIYCFHLAPLGGNPFEGSMSARFLKNVAPGSYIFSFGIYKKLGLGVEKNEEVVKYYETQNSIRRDSQKRDRSRSAK